MSKKETMGQIIGITFNYIIGISIFIYLILLLHGIIDIKSEKNKEYLKKYQQKNISYILVWGGLFFYILKAATQLVIV